MWATRSPAPGDGVMALVNEGTIIATGSNSLQIDAGANTIVNSGTLEATGSGGLVIDGNVENSGLLRTVPTLRSWQRGNAVMDGSPASNSEPLHECDVRCRSEWNAQARRFLRLQRNRFGL
jgi:hypothetical protein